MSPHAQLESRADAPALSELPRGAAAAQPKPVLFQEFLSAVSSLATASSEPATGSQVATVLRAVRTRAGAPQDMSLFQSWEELMLRFWVAVVLLASSSAFAATADTRELLEGERVTEFVSISLKIGPPLSLEYSTTSVGELKASQRLEATQTLLADDNVKVLLEFVNPVTHTWSATEEVKDDPSFVALKEFATAANGFVTILGGGSTTTSGTNAASLMGAQPSWLKVSAPDLVELAMWLQQKPYSDCRANPGYEKTLSDSDAEVYVSSDTDRAANEWRTKSLAALAGVKDATSLSQFRSANEKLTEGIEDLKNWNKKARAGIQAVDNGAKSFIKASQPGCEAFAVYAQVALAQYVASATKLIDAREKMVEDLTVIRDAAQKEINRSGTDAATNKDYFEVASVASEVSKVKLLTFTLKRREISLPKETDPSGRIIITEKESVSAVLRFRRYQALVVEAAPGFALVFGDQPRAFGTATVDGKTVVTSTAAEKLGVLATLMANFIPRIWRSSAVWLIAQVGVGVGKPAAMALAGLGLRFSWFDLSITGGAAFTFPNVPQTYRVGDVVADAAALDNDLRPRVVVSPYLGFQKSF